MPKFKISAKIKRPDFNKIGVRQFSDSRAKEKIVGWFHSAMTDNFMVIFALLWLLPLLGIAVYALVNLASLPDQIPLFYSRKWGETQLATRNYIFVPMIGSFLLGIFNFCLGINFHPKDRVLSYLLAGTATIISIMTAITVFNIINLMK